MAKEIKKGKVIPYDPVVMERTSS